MGESRLGQPSDDAAKQSSNGQNPFQVSLVDVAPLERVADKDKDKKTPWRRTWGEVAPGAQDLPPVNPQMDKDPNQNGGNGVPPWRARPGVAPGVPGAVEQPGDKPADKPNPGGPANPGGGGGGVDDWKTHVGKEKPIEGPGWPAPDGSGGPGGLAPNAGDNNNFEAPKRPKSSVTGFLYTGGATGAVIGGGSYLLDAKLLAQKPGTELSGMMKLWERVSPAAAGLAQQRGDLARATEEYGVKMAAFSSAESTLRGLATVPTDILKATEARLVTLQPLTGQLSQLQAQQHFLQNIGTVAKADDVLKVIGPAGTEGKLFEAGSSAAVELERYAAYLRAKEAGTLGLTAPSVSTTLAEVEGRLASMSASITELGTTQARLEFLKKGLSGSSNAVEAVLGTAEEVAAGQKLFVRGSTQATELMAFANASNLNAEATRALDTARGAMSAKEGALKAAQERGAAEFHGSFTSASFRGLAKGLGVSAATLAAGYGADYLLGQQFGYKPNHDGMGRFLLDGVAIPTIILSDLQPRTKIWMGTAAFLGARTMDFAQGMGASTETSLLLRPNTIDAIGITGSMLAPIPGKYKAIGIASTLVLGRGWNYIARKTGLDGYNSSGEVLDTDLTNLRTLDTTTQSAGSFDNTVQKAKELGLSDPYTLERRLIESMNRTNLHPVEQDRATAALAYGLGLARLEQGSRLDVTDFKPSAYFMQGKKFDFGGLAAEQLNSAVASLEHAKKYAEGHKGETLNGRTMDDAYVRQLDELRSKVLRDLDPVYGEQNMTEVYSTVKGLCRTKVTSILSFMADGPKKLASLGANISPTDAKFAAKLARDLAIANLAYAEQCIEGGNGEDARVFFKAGVDHIDGSEGFEKGHKNVAKLKEIADRIRTKIPGAVQSQWNNTRNNPFEIQPNK